MYYPYLWLQDAMELTQRFGDDARVEIETVHQLTLDLAETLANFNLILLIGAHEAEPVGGFFTQKILLNQNLPHIFSHYLNPAELLGVC